MGKADTSSLDKSMNLLASSISMPITWFLIVEVKHDPRRHFFGFRADSADQFDV